MLAPSTVFRLKVKLIEACQDERVPIVKGTRAYRRVGKFNVPVPFMGKYARRTLTNYQRRHGLPADGTFNAPTQRKLMPPSVGEKAVAIMEGWAREGWRESPAFSNEVPKLAAYAAHHGLTKWYQNMGWPWCAFAGFLALKAAGSRTAAAGFAGRFNALYTVDILRTAQRREDGMRVVPPSQVKRGLIALINFPGGQIVDHFGMTRGRIILGFVRLVEGNTSASSAGSQSNGGQMACKIRRASTITFVEAT